MATHTSILAQKIPWTEEPGGLKFMGVTKESDMTQQLNNNKMLKQLDDFQVPVYLKTKNNNNNNFLSLTSTHICHHK